jgi:four helix bundle protein
MAEGFRDLIVWQRSVQMTLSIYRFTAGFPQDERYGLTSQLRRAAVSVASNIAEGWGRGTDGEYKHSLGMSRGSNAEIQTQLYIAAELGYGDMEKGRSAEALSNEVARMLVGLMRTV